LHPLPDHLKWSDFSKTISRQALFAPMSSTSIVAYLALFAIVGFLFLFVSLLIGRLLRPRNPSPEKRDIYECGEPTIGTSFVQFDLRFYVVALLFLIFDVEVAFFFPWATVFGKATRLMDQRAPQAVPSASQPERPELSRATAQLYRELGVEHPQLPAPQGGLKENLGQIRQTGEHLALASVTDLGVFFAVLLVGFAYVWTRGDLDWVRAVPGRSAEPAAPAEPAEPVHHESTAGPQTS
jgi:NADH-quinone oxidoreductase subunit A